MKNFLIIVGFVSIISGCASHSDKDQYDQKRWLKYTNNEYGYEIYYPENFDFWPTGPENRRDGSTIRIAYKDHEAPAPVLDITIDPKTSPAEFENKWGNIKDMKMKSSQIQIGGETGTQIEYRWNSTNEISFVIIYLEGIVFTFHAGSGMQKFQGTDWWSIISSYRFL
jgi:hypothetical protein